LGHSVSEAAVADKFFREQGLDPTRLILEGKSRNTAENASLSLLIANPQPGEKWVLVTSASHMPRAMRSFKAAGWPILIPYPVDYRSNSLSSGLGWNLLRNAQILNLAAKEYSGQLIYALAGR
jgi:uncharacterized SAM-binding protein YcdF (DUF218 family)